MEEWIKKYESKAEKYIHLPGYQVYFEPDKGFFLYAQFGPVFEVDHVCTNDVKHMYKTANDMAKARGCTLLRTQTFHSPAPFMRLLKCTPNLTLSGIRPNGRMYWCMEKKVK
jgi:hypothetical protein